MDPCKVCGPYSQCKQINGQAVCSCLSEYIGVPPACRPECAISAECPLDQACIKQKCVNPCLGACGHNAECRVINHNPLCVCPPTFEGDPFVACRLAVTYEPTVVSPCDPSPCGPNSICRADNGLPSCTCMTGYQGQAPYCKPECISNSECPSQLVCRNNKCTNPCIGSCGTNAECKVLSHSIICLCSEGYTGNPMVQCTLAFQEEPLAPCSPSPCGPNANCREQNGVGACKCIENYFGNPYEGCQPECLIDQDCAGNRACIGNKCQDPCTGRCGINANCFVINHTPTCYCNNGYTGDAHRRCALLSRKWI